MASNQNFDGSGFLFGSSLVGADGFLKCHGVYLGPLDISVYNIVESLKDHLLLFGIHQSILLIRDALESLKLDE